MEVTSILGKTHFRRVLFPVGKHMRGGAENNEASPRHLPALLSRKYNTPPGQLRPPTPLSEILIMREGMSELLFNLWFWKRTWKTKSLKLRAVWNLFGVACPARWREANFVWFFFFFRTICARGARSSAHTQAPSTRCTCRRTEICTCTKSGKICTKGKCSHDHLDTRMLSFAFTLIWGPCLQHICVVIVQFTVYKRIFFLLCVNHTQNRL